MTVVEEVPALVPARMLNEYAYCPRLFFLEWVDQLWAASADTAEGDRRHRRVDSGGGAVPLPSDGEVKTARSVELSSERLGIIVPRFCDHPLLDPLGACRQCLAAWSASIAGSRLP